MRISSRSFPHPVVGNGDDVPAAEFQAAYDFSSDKTTFYLKATVACNSKSVLKLIEKGKACYTLHVECSNTLYRKTYDFTAAEYPVALPATEVHDDIEVNAFVRATAAVPRYKVDGAHDDYGDATFDVRPGDILAVADGQVFDASQKADPLRRVGSLMLVQPSGQAGDHPLLYDTNGDRILILLCESDFADYAAMKATPLLTDHLTTTLVLPVLVEVLHDLADEEEPGEQKWKTLLRQRMAGMKLLPAGIDTLVKAQRLLDLPIRRALRSAKTQLDKAES